VKGKKMGGREREEGREGGQEGTTGREGDN
jgi:hypothetical protein